jgi:alkyl hydroperoxide reductase subunit F
MLGDDLKDQLRSVFQGLGARIDLVVDRSEHAQQRELLDMLEDIAVTSPEIVVAPSAQISPIPAFTLHRDGKPTGVRFHGIPGGHEFTSLVVAILNAAGKGKLPDPGLQQRIKQLKGGVTIRTFISLTCENCPDVVQALNQIALVHGDLEHVMVDGAYVQDEIEKLNVQGVPSVVIEQDLLHSGRATLAELIGKLEERLGREASSAPVDLGRFDVAVLGGGPAGVSAAIYSARKGLKTALIAETLGGQVQQTKGIENLISVPYTEGLDLTANLDKHLRGYEVTVLEHRRVRTVEKLGAGPAHALALDSGEELACDQLIVATGAKWRELGVPGEKQYIGRGVAFCPHCDGPYYKGRKVAVVGGGNSGVEAAIDLAGICSEVVLLEFVDKLKADDVLVKKLGTLPNVQVITSAKTTEVLGNGDKVVALVYEDRQSGELKRVELDGVFVQIGLSPNSAVVKEVVELTRYGEIVVDAKGRTSAPGVYAAGDVTTVPFKQIVIAMGDGAKAALTAFEDRMRAGEPAAA